MSIILLLVGTNGAIVYSLLEDGGVFDIDPSTGYLSLTSTLDTETIPRFIYTTIFTHV